MTDRRGLFRTIRDAHADLRFWANSTSFVGAERLLAAQAGKHGALQRLRALQKQLHGSLRSDRKQRLVGSTQRIISAAKAHDVKAFFLAVRS
eukprot:15435774-Alexandrium_andersonii.AAC.1